MRNTLSKVLCFTAGAVAGSAVTYFLVKEKYERRAQEEIDSVIDTFSSTDEELEDEDDDVENDWTKEDQAIYDQLIEQSGYTNQPNDANQNITEKEVDEHMDEPIVISPDELGELEYEVLTYTYYEGDGVLTDEFDEPSDGIAGMKPEDIAELFGQYEDDSAFLRVNTELTDYEVLKDHRSYSESRE